MRTAALLGFLAACGGSSSPAVTAEDVEAAVGVLGAACRRMPENAPPALATLCAALPAAEVRPFPPPDPPKGFGGYVPVATEYAGSGGAQ